MSMTTDHIAAALTQAGIECEQVTEEHPYRHHFVGALSDAADRRVVTVDVSGAWGTVCAEVSGTGIDGLSPVSPRKKLSSITAIVAFMREGETVPTVTT